MTNVNLILGVLAAIAVGVILVGLVLMDTTVWYVIDVFHGVLLTIIAVRLLYFRKDKKQSK